MNAKQLIKEAGSIEASARESLDAWVILGQTDKYAAAMDKASALRKAAAMKRTDRKEFLKNAGLL